MSLLLLSLYADDMILSVLNLQSAISTLFSPSSPLIAVFFWSHAEQGPSVHHRKCGGEWPRPDARLPQSRACWPRLPPTPRPCSGLLRTALKTKNTCRALTTHKHTDFDNTHTCNHSHLCAHINMHIITDTQIQILTFLHTWIHRHTLRIIISRSCCHWLILQVKYNCGVNSGEKKTTMTITLACSIHFIVFLEDTILISTNRQESQHRLTWNELRAVNLTAKLIMMMIVIKMMIAADVKKKTTKQLCSCSVFVGQCRPASRTPWQRLTKTTNIVFIIIIIMVIVILTCLQRLSARYYHP